MAVTTINTRQIKNATILDEDVDSAAAIAGSKISPNFGSQTLTAGVGNFTTTGSSTLNLSNTSGNTLVDFRTSGATEWNVYLGGGTTWSLYDSVNSHNVITATQAATSTVAITGNETVSGTLTVTDQATFNGSTAIVANSTINNIALQYSGVTKWIHYLPSSDWALYDNVASTDRLRITTAGNATLNANLNQTLNTQTVNGGIVRFGDTAGSTDLGNLAGNVGTKTGIRNTSVGLQAGAALTDGLDNTFIGQSTGVAFTTGDNATFVGSYAGYQATTEASNNTFIGASAGHAGVGVTTGQGNTLIGYSAQTNSASALNRTSIGNAAACDTDNKIQLGNSAVTAMTLGNNVLVATSTGLGVTTTPNTDSRASGTLTLGASIFLGVLAGDPSSPVAGQIWYNNTTNQFMGYNGTAKIILG